LLEWVLCEILGALPLRPEHIEEDNRELFSMPAGARLSIERRNRNCEFYVVFKCSEKDVAGGMGLKLLHRVILESDGLGADMTQA